jgi:hypothetical protein
MGRTLRFINFDCDVPWDRKLLARMTVQLNGDSGGTSRSSNSSNSRNVPMARLLHRHCTPCQVEDRAQTRRRARDSAS